MIERIEAHVQGQVYDNSIDGIKADIVYNITNRYERLFSEKTPGKNWTAKDLSRYAAYLMFGQEHFISVNSKNIEFVDSFHYDNNGPMTEDQEKMLKKGWVKDFLIQLYIYRLGRFSYYAATITPLIEDVIDCG